MLQVCWKNSFWVGWTKFPFYVLWQQEYGCRREPIKCEWSCIKNKPVFLFNMMYSKKKILCMREGLKGTFIFFWISKQHATFYLKICKAYKTLSICVGYKNLALSVIGLLEPKSRFSCNQRYRLCLLLRFGKYWT